VTPPSVSRKSADVELIQWTSVRPWPKDIVAQSQDTRKGLTYYNFELANHTLVSPDSVYDMKLFSELTLSVQRRSTSVISIVPDWELCVRATRGIC
jgi:hypothetical protein